MDIVVKSKFYGAPPALYAIGQSVSRRTFGPSDNLPLIRHSWRVLAGIDDATASETVLLYQMNHASIILVCIYSDVRANRSAPVYYYGKYAAELSTRCYAMDCAIL